MKLDGATLPIEKRGLGACLDLASRLYMTDLRKILSLMAFFAIPAVLASYVASVFTEDGMALGLAFFYLLSPILGALLVAGEGPRAFGETFTVRKAVRLLLSRVWTVTLPILARRLLVVGLAVPIYSFEPLVLVFLYPPVVIAFGYGTMLSREVALLERLSGKRLRGRVRDLTRSGSSPSPFARYLGTIVFFVIVVSSLFILVDTASGLLLGLPLYDGRFASEYFVEAAGYLLRSDPLIVVTLQALLWLVYPIARLTFFLSYLDIRIRRECWDIELDFRVEASRLEGLR